MLPPAEAAAVFAALGDPTRLGLVERLAREAEPRSLSSLADGLPLTRQAVTKHLRVLEGAGLVSSLRAGRETRFALVPDRVDALRSYLETVDRHWDAALARLGAHLDRNG